MDRLSRVALIASLVFIGSCAGSRIDVGDYEIQYFIGFACSGLILAILSFVRVFGLLSDWPKTSALPLVISAIALVVAGFTPFHEIAELFNSPRVLAGSCEHNVCYTHLVLRQDSTAENITLCFGKQIQRGKYLLRGDTVVLSFPEKSSIRNKLLLMENELRELPDADTTRRLLTFGLYINELSKK